MLKKPSDIDFSILPASDYFEIIYKELYSKIDTTKLEPQIDFDDVSHSDLEKMYIDYGVQGCMKQFSIKSITAKEYALFPAQKALLVFLRHFPSFYIFLKNVNADADISIKNAEYIVGAKVDNINFITIKSVIDRQNKKRWTRDMNVQEKNSGVSILGTTSETLLEKAMDNLIDKHTFFKNTNNEVQSYGDFVLMCLPNNLWLSVKSNFARERLLASGYTTDIIGVGFFTDFKEFTSQSKIRNFSKVGFLAMYLPDVPVSLEQVATNENTYNQVVAYYETNERQMPKNINGTNFIRKLSTLSSDLTTLLNEKDIKKRTTISF